MTVREALLRYGGFRPDQIDDRNSVFIKAVETGLDVGKDDSLGKLWMALFDEAVEEKLWGPFSFTDIRWKFPLWPGAMMKILR